MAKLLLPALILLKAVTAWSQEPLNPPQLRLPEGVQPTRYQASLQLVPGQDQFQGHIRIELNISRTTSVIWLNARSLQFQSGVIRFEKSEEPVRLQTSGSDFVGVVAKNALPPGPAQLEIDYTGEVSRTLTDGAFQQKQGDDWYVFTKFEPVTARRVFPCFDEPSYKVPWQLTLTFPKGLRAFSNTPEASGRALGEMTQTSFEQTKPLPSYLVAFAVGPFEAVPTQPLGRNKVPGRLIVPRGRSAEAAYAASVTPRMVMLLENYFGRPYPYRKLDQIVVPVTTAWGAMENAGLIAYGDFLLSPPQQDTELRQRGRVQNMEHEMAHQWFGDLVTMKWWDDVWLNEAFASWIESKLLDEWKPEWNLKANAARSGSVFQADSLTTARRIRQPIETPGDIGNAFDGITYVKGEAVIGMFENYVGPSAFQKAVQLYLSQHEWGNATSSDLLHAIDQISPQSRAGAAFSTFLNQVGFPLVTAQQKCGTDLDAGHPVLQVSQTRFLPLGTSSEQEQIWQVPVCAVWSDGSTKRKQCELLTKPSDTFPLHGAKACPVWLSVNADAAGYYVDTYETRTGEALIHQGLKELTSAERAALLRSTGLLFSSGLGRPEQELALVSEFGGSSEAGLVRQSVAIVESVKRFAPADLQGKYTEWVRKLYQAKARSLGWRPQPGETQEVRMLRMSIVPEVATEGDDTQLATQARQLAHQWLQEKSGIDPDLVAPILTTAAWNGDRAFFDELVAAIKGDQVKRERALMIRALGAFRSPVLAGAALDLLLQPGIDSRELIRLPLYPSNDAREITWDFVRNHYDQLNSSLPSARGVPFGATLPMAAAGFCDAGHGEEVERFFSPKVNSLPGGARYLANTLEKIRLCTARAEVTRSAVTEYLTKR